jgi:RNA-directed DNA polymerase
MENSNTSMNPTGGEADWRRPMQPALEINLMERILASGNLHRAWKQVKSNKGASGIDGMALKDFPPYARLQWDSIRQSLRDGTYQPSPVRRVVIPKPGGKRRTVAGSTHGLRPSNPASHPGNPNPHLRPWIFRLKLWEPSKAKCPRRD